MSKVVKFRKRADVPRWTFPVTRSEPSQYRWEAPIPITVEGSVQVINLVRAIEAGGFRVAFDSRTFCMIVRGPQS